MPRKQRADNSRIFDALKCFPELFSEDGTLKTSTSPVWKDACLHPYLTESCSAEEGNILKKALYKPKQLHDYVYQNRYNLLTLLRTEFGLSLEQTESSTDSDETFIDALSESTNEDTEKPDFSKEQKIFKLTIPYEDYLKMQPTSVFYKEGSCTKRRKVLKRGAWTSIIIEHFYKKFKIPCAYSFRRNKVRVSENCDDKFLYAEGICKECNSKICIAAEDEPVYPNPLILSVKATDTTGVKHCKKTPVTGARRARIAEELLHTAPTNWRRKSAAENMIFGEDEPPTLPSISVCRTIRQEAKKAEYELPHNKDPIKALMEMKYSSYAGSIHSIGHDKFFVHYWSKEQNYIYKAQAKVSHTKVHIDATGSLVRKIRDQQRTSSHIFLYEVVIHMKNMPISVSQMISEGHDTSTIEYWLNKWLKDVKRVPQESITDFSLALIGATCRAFNECSIKAYLNLAFSILRGEKFQKPACYIRIDVAHLIKFVSRWQCYPNKARLVRKFYIRCVALMIKCTSMKILKDLILQTLILSRSDTCGNRENGLGSTVCENAKIFLGRCIETGNPDSIITENVLESTEALESEKLEEFETIKELDSWIKDISLEADAAVQDIGIDPNPYFCPDFGKNLTRLLQYCPLWTAIMSKLYDSPYPTASSAIVEADFGILKNIILEHHKRPLRIDKFVACHLKALSGNMNIAAAAVKNSISEDENNLIEELNAEESWKNKNIKKAPLILQSQSPEKQKIHRNKSDEEIQTSQNKKYRHKKFCYPSHQQVKCSEQKISDCTTKKDLTQSVQSKSIYLNPYPNISISLNSPLDKYQCLQIMKNGNLLEPIKYNNFACKITNTCPFDALVHSLAVICVDNEQYFSFVIKSDNLLLKFIQSYIENGVSKNLYMKRFELLSKIYRIENSSVITNMCYLNAEDSMGNIVQSLLKDEPSAREIYACQNSHCPNNTERGILFWPLNLNLLKAMDFENAISSSATVINKPCKHPCKLRTTITTFPKQHIIIEPRIGQSTQYFLSDFPEYVTVASEKFSLCSVVMYVHGGHFISYCRRKNNSWELYDDLKSSVNHVDPKKVRGITEIVIYAKV